MNAISAYALVLTSSYLLGAVPFAFLIGRLRGVDIRTAGSGNVGATNVFRCVGKAWGILCFFCDAAKGFVPAFFFPSLAVRLEPRLPLELLGILCAAAAIAGHNWPVYLRFKGGKGVATSAGALLGIAWQAVGIGLLAWILVFAAGRYVSVASLAAAVVVAAAAWFLRATGSSLLLPIALTLLAALITIRHRGNIRRLVQGTEHRWDFHRRKPPQEPPPSP